MRQGVYEKMGLAGGAEMMGSELSPRRPWAALQSQDWPPDQLGWPGEGPAHLPTGCGCLHPL